MRWLMVEESARRSATSLSSSRERRLRMLQEEEVQPDSETTPEEGQPRETEGSEAAQM